jgi:hypothetical protein
MKKIILTVAAVFALSFANAQDKKEASGAQTSEGKWVIEANTGSLATGSTAFSYSSFDGSTSYNIGLDGGYFIMENLAIKAGVGFGGSKPDGGDSTTSTTYKIGAQYYIMGKIPVGVDYTGFSSEGTNASWIGIEGGYAWFLGSNVAVTPKLRYNATMDEAIAVSGFLGLFGFALYF